MGAITKTLRCYAIVGALLLLLLTLGATPASADTITLSLGNTAISGYSGPYATVDVTLTDSTHATVTFSGNTVGGYTFLMGDGGAVALNTNGTASVNVAGITFLQLPGFTTASFEAGGAGNEDGFGKFNFSLNDKTIGGSGYTGAVTSVTFNLTNTTGTWASATNVLTPNSGGYTAAAHIFVCNSSSGPCTKDAGALDTGYAANGVPEPASIALFGSGLLTLGAIIRRRRKQ